MVDAHDTLIVAGEPAKAELYMKAVESAGANYGLEYNWKQLEFLAIGCGADLLRPDGAPIPQKGSLVYLGSVLSANGTVQAELSRCLGSARSEFDALSRA